MELSRLRRITALAGGASLAIVTSGCGGGGSDEPASAENPIELSVTTFGQFGYDDLYAEYEEQNPGVTIEANNIDGSANARTDAFTKLAAGSGLSDVVAVEEGWLGSIMEVSDQFVDLNEYGAEDLKDNWVDWKFEQGTDPDGRVIGYGTDIGPQALCFNQELFEAAGLPTDREQVAELFGGDDATWEIYFDLGRQYNEATGKAWYDQSSFVWNSMVNQMDEGYYTADGELNIEGNEAMRAQFDLLAAGTADGLSANQKQFDWGKGKAFVDGSFAVHVCPAWMLGTIQEQLESGAAEPRPAGTWPTSSRVAPPTGEEPSSPSPRAPSTPPRLRSWQRG